MSLAIHQQSEYIETLQAEIETLKAELEHSLKREQLTRHILEFIDDHSTDVEHILTVTAQAIGRFFEVDRCLVIYHEGKSIEHSRIVAQYRQSQEIIPIQDEDVPWAQFVSLIENADKEHLLILLNVSHPEQFPDFFHDYATKYDIQAALSVEIRYREFSFGRIGLHQCKHPRVWLESEIDFFQSLIPYIGSCLYQAELYQQEQEAKRRAEEANRKKTKLLAYVTHDFKNPLASLSRFIDMFQSDKTETLSLKQQEIIHHMAEGIQLLRDIVSNILDRGRLEEGEIKPIPQCLDLSVLVKELHFLLETIASEKGIELQIEIQPSIKKVYLDPVHLKQILINLVSNAVKYNRAHGKIFIRFSEIREDAAIASGNQTLLIEVQDTGFGIPAEKIPHLFTDYYRMDFSKTQPIEGTGLGLPFIKKLVERYGGSITVESTLGIGSTFKITLPLN